MGDGLGDLPLSHARRPVEVQGQPRLATADTFDRFSQAPSRLLGQRQALEIERGRVPGAEAAQPSIGGILAEEVAHDRLVEPYGPGQPRRARDLVGDEMDEAAGDQRGIVGEDEPASEVLPRGPAEQVEDEPYRRPAAGRVVVQPGEEAFVLEIDLHGQRHGERVHLEARQGEEALEADGGVGVG